MNGLTTRPGSGSVLFMPTTYRLADAPKLASQYEFDCHECGHETLTRPVFVTCGNGPVAVGTGCAAKLLGLPVAEVAADHSARHLADLVADRDPLRQVWGWFLTCLPTRVTARFIADTVARFRLNGVTADEVETIAAIYRTITKVRPARSVTL
jgi:hypothetical protein